MIRLLLAILPLIAAASAEEIPDWILPAIARVESRSWYDSERLHYVDKRRGAAGERGPWQCTHIAFRQVRRHGEQFWQVETDTDFAAEIASRYMAWNYRRTGSWDRAISAYNPGDRSYLRRVKKAAM